MYRTWKKECKSFLKTSEKLAKELECHLKSINDREKLQKEHLKYLDFTRFMDDGIMDVQFRLEAFWDRKVKKIMLIFFLNFFQHKFIYGKTLSHSIDSSPKSRKRKKQPILVHDSDSDEDDDVDDDEEDDTKNQKVDDNEVDDNEDETEDSDDDSDEDSDY